MSNYGLNFGFMRSDESIRRAEGRYRTPKGAALPMGTLVTIDFANPGFLRKAAAADVALPAGMVGVLSQETSHLPRLGQAPLLDTADYGTALADEQSEMSYGAGTKIWLANTPQRDRGYKVFPAVTMWTGLTAGDEVTVNAEGVYVKAAADAASIGTVTAIIGDRAEIVLSK